MLNQINITQTSEGKLWMPVMRCGKESCQRYISVSRIPDGNPKAKASPELFSQGYKQCSDFENCGAYHCDRHWGGKCVKCGSHLTSVRWGPETQEEHEHLRRSEEYIQSTTLTKAQPEPVSQLKPEQVSTNIDVFAQEAQRGFAQSHITILKLEELHNKLLFSLCKGDVEKITVDFMDRIYNALSGECPKCNTKYPGDILKLAVLMQANPEHTIRELEKHKSSESVISVFQKVAAGHCINPECSFDEIEIQWKGISL